MTRALVLGRRREGRPIEAAVADTAARLAAAGWEVGSAVVDRKRELRRATADAVAGGVDAVVAVGGDGAVLQVIQKLAGKGARAAAKAGDAVAKAGEAAPDAGAAPKAVLGIVPLGTGNLLATNLGIPKAGGGSVEAAVDVLLAQHQRAIDVGEIRVGGKSARKRVFSVACGVGFDAEVMNATAKSSKRRFGKLAYFAAALGRGRRMRNARHDITIDGVKHSGLAAQVFVANFGGMGLPLEPRLQVVPDDGLLDVIIVRAGGPVQGILAGWEALRQRRRGRSGSGRVFRAHARSVKIASRPRRLVETDGSVIGKTPISIKIRPGALAVLVPADTATAADPSDPAS